MSGNLEYHIIEKAFFMNDAEEVKDYKTAENLYRKLLGILNENGPYAFILFLQSRFNKEKEDKIARSVSCQLANFLQDTLEVTGFNAIEINNNNYRIEELKDWCRHAAGDIHELFFFKEILEKILSYALYDARAREATGKSG
jgi:hypothetical protein